MSGECNYCGGEHAEDTCQCSPTCAYGNGHSSGYADGFNSRSDEVQALKQALSTALSERDAAASKLPPTYYADRTLAERVEFMVKHWQCLVLLVEGLERERDAAREAVERLDFAMSNIAMMAQDALHGNWPHAAACSEILLVANDPSKAQAHMKDGKYTDPPAPSKGDAR